MYESWRFVFAKRVGHVLQLVVPVEPETDFDPSEIDLEKLTYFVFAQAYLKENYSETYVDWTKVKGLVQQYNRDASTLVEYLKGLVRTRMNVTYPMLTEENSPIPKVKVNYYHLTDLVGTLYDALIDELSGLKMPFPGYDESPIISVQSYTDSGGRCSIWVPEGPTLIETDKEEYYDTKLLTRTLRPIATDTVLKQSFESLDQTYSKIRIQLGSFSQKLLSNMEKIGLGDV